MSTVLTTEELRVAALEASARRGKWVAKRRIMWRWFAWANWTFVLPSIGLLTVLVATAGFVFWQYLGAEQAYKTTQSWLQDQFPVEAASSPLAAATTSTAPTESFATEPTANLMTLKTTLRLSTELSTHLASPKTEPESPKP